jgi:hypothetical protein
VKLFDFLIYLLVTTKHAMKCIPWNDGKHSFSKRIPYFYETNRFLWGHAVAHLVEALRYKPEGRGFNFGIWNF